MIVLSILIPTLHKRKGLLSKLLTELNKQRTPEIEILTYADDGAVTTGRKRNDLIKQAAGNYIVAIDDDDMVAPTYIADILGAAKHNPDCITFNGWMETDGTNRTEFRLGIGYPYIATTEKGKVVYLRYPNHITPIRRTIALTVPFPNVSMGEDYDWATKLHNGKLLKTEVRIDKPLYFYQYRTVKP
jgi:glycosyltransferase involved in cell wall biosynthesis